MNDQNTDSTGTSKNRNGGSQTGGGSSSGGSSSGGTGPKPGSQQGK